MQSKKNYIYKEIKDLKAENEYLKKEIQLKKDIKEDNELINVELKNGSSNYCDGYRKFQVYKIKKNLIKISGLINCNLKDEICTLPENCRPKERLIFICMSSNGAIRVDALASGANLLLWLWKWMAFFG